jgi:hypothetical protein
VFDDSVLYSEDMNTNEIEYLKSELARDQKRLAKKRLSAAEYISTVADIRRLEKLIADAEAAQS